MSSSPVEIATTASHVSARQRFCKGIYWLMAAEGGGIERRHVPKYRRIWSYRYVSCQPDSTDDL